MPPDVDGSICITRDGTFTRPVHDLAEAAAYTRFVARWGRFASVKLLARNRRPHTPFQGLNPTAQNGDFPMRKQLSLAVPL